MIHIYGSPKSSAGRCYWVLEELGLPYEKKSLDMQKKEHKSEAFLQLNPNGKVPCLVDEDFVIWESMAINTYLCEKYGRQFLGKTPQEQGLISQWSIWSLVDLQRPLIDMFIQLVFVPEERRDLDLLERSRKVALPLLAILNQSLHGKEYLVGERFTLADLNVASVTNICQAVHIDLSQNENLTRWMNHCTSRPASKKVASL